MQATDPRSKTLLLCFDDRVLRGCNSGEIESAVSNVLDDSLPDPRIPDPVQRNSKLDVWRINISSEDDPLCYGIKIIREQSYTDAYSAPGDPLPAREFKILVGGNEISSGSYVKAGITSLGLMPSTHTNPPRVHLNTIGASSCDEAETAVAIQFGNHFPIDPTSNVIEEIEKNTIHMENNLWLKRNLHIDSW